MGSEDRVVPVSAAEGSRRRFRSPVFRDGAFMPGAATVQPATLARGLRRVLLERGVIIFEGRKTAAVEVEGQRPMPLGAVSTAHVRRPHAGATGSACDRCASARDRRRVMARSSPGRRSRAECVGCRVAVVRASARDVVLLHRPDRADARPPGRPRLDRRRGRRRRALHPPLPADDTGWRPTSVVVGRAGFGGRIGITDDCSVMPAGRPPGCGGSSRHSPTSASRTRGACSRHHEPSPAMVRLGPRPADPLRPGVQRQRRRAVRGWWSGPRGACRGGCRGPSARVAACGWEAASGIPARARPVRRGSLDPRGCSPSGNRWRNAARIPVAYCASSSCHVASAITSDPTDPGTQRGMAEIG